MMYKLSIIIFVLLLISQSLPVFAASTSTKTYTSSGTITTKVDAIYPASASPNIDIRINRSFFQWLTKQINSRSAPIITVTNPHGETIIRNNTLEDFDSISLDANSLIPGSYSISINEKIVTNFLWGVLALNFDKNIYLPQESVKIDMAVLDQHGEMVCDARLKLEITDPTGTKVDLTTDQNQIIINSVVCHSKALTITPDYTATYTPKVAGSYQIKLIASTQNGDWEISDSFSVATNPDFQITRKSATRIYPLNTYPMAITIRPQSDFRGTFQEIVPRNFQVMTKDKSDLSKLLNIPQSTINSGSSGSYKITNNSDHQILSWEVNWRSGQAYTLYYYYDAPDVSPEFYFLGPASLVQNQQKIYSEPRSWQIASDAPPTQVTGTANISTGSTAYVQMDSMVLTPGAGDYMVHFSTSIQKSTGSSDQFIALYVGESQVAHSVRRVGADSSWASGEITSHPISIDAYVASVGATSTIEIRWYTTAGTTTAHQRTLIVEPVTASDITQATATGTTTTTSTTDITMGSMSVTPGAGSYLVFFGTSVYNGSASSIYASVYIGSSQVAESEQHRYVEASFPSVEEFLGTHAFIQNVGSTDIITVKWRTTAGTATAFERTLIAQKIDPVTITQVSSNVGTSTTSATDTLLDSMYLTPGAGDYLVYFSTTLKNTAIATVGAAQHLSIYTNSTQVTHTNREVYSEESYDLGEVDGYPLLSHAQLSSVGVGDTIQVKYHTEQGTVTAYNRTLTAYKLTSPIHNSSAYSFQRKTWSDGTRFWRSSQDTANDRIAFEYSTDGTTWIENTSARISTDTTDFSVQANSTNAFIAYKTSAVTNQDNLLTSGIRAYWKMDESLWNTTSNEVVDSSGNSLHLTAANNATTTSAKFSNGGTFDGTNDYVNCSDANCGGSGKLDFLAGASFSWGGWFKTTNNNALQHIGGKRTSNSTSAPGYAMELSSGAPSCWVSDGTAHVVPLATDLINDGNWHHSFCVVDGITVSIFVDGVLKSSLTNDGVGNSLNNSFDNTEPFKIGEIGNGNQDYTGLVDDYRVYARALTSTEIAQLAHPGYDIEVRQASSYPGTSFSWGNPTIAFNGYTSTDYYQYPTIAKDTDDKVWVMSNRYASDTLSKQISAADDDGMSTSAGGVWHSYGQYDDGYTNTSNMMLGGKEGGAGNASTTGLRFTNINIPQGATINSSTLDFMEYFGGGYSTNVKNKTYASDEDDCSLGSGYLPSSKTKTTANHTWDSNGSQGSAGQWYQASATVIPPDISTEIKEVVDRSGWSRGNDLCVLIEDNGSTVDWWFEVYSFESGSTNAAKIDISFTTSEIDVIQASTANDITSWGSISNLDSSTNTNKYGVIVPRTSGDAFATWIDGTAIESKNFSGGTWASSPTAVGTGLTGLANSFSLLADDSGNAHLAYIGVGGSAVYREFTTSWQTAVNLDTNAGNSYPGLSLNTANSGVYAFWTRSNHIYYKKGLSPFTSGSWDSATDWITTGTNTNMSTDYSASNVIFAQWQDTANLDWDKITTAFPVVIGSTTSDQSGNSTNPTISLPSGVAAGDLIITFLAHDGAPAISWPGSWVELVDLDTGASDAHLSIAYLIASGGETTVSPTSTVSERSQHLSIRIAAGNWHGTAPPEVGIGTSASSKNPDSASLTPSWGAADTLWISAFGMDGPDIRFPVTAYPSEYTNDNLSNGTTDTSTAGVAIASRGLNATSADPGAFTTFGSDNWVAFTLAVRPYGGAGPTDTPTPTPTPTNTPTPTPTPTPTNTPTPTPTPTPTTTPPPGDFKFQGLKFQGIKLY